MQDQISVSLLKCWKRSWLSSEKAQFTARSAWVLAGLEYALDWCDVSFGVSIDEGSGRVLYQGWNSGGDLATLSAGKPESWATAVVHMFFSELNRVLSSRIRDVLLNLYDAGLGQLLR